MTREEAIKKVRVALERLKSNFGKTAWWTGTGEAFEMLIPELKESEDERIRKAIVHLLEVASEAYLIEATGFKKEQFLSYLEKQKVLTEHKEGIYYYHRDGTFTFISHPAVENPHNFTVPKPNEKPVDYDHEMWKNCEANFECGKKEVIDHPEKYGLQKEQKPWSEEDEKIIQSLILEFNKYVFFAGIEANKIIGFLKSLRPSWKPSEEQMDALERASTNKYLSAKQFDILVSLYEQLKKL